jgi:glycine dehydrogenase subunit 1
MSVTKRPKKAVVAGSVHPEYRQIIQTYFAELDAELITVAARSGIAVPSDLAESVDSETACVLVQYPNFFGCVEDVAAAAKIAHEKGALLIVACDPISLGLIKRPGELGADVVIAEGQMLGTPMQFGGPYLGIMACREQFVRRMPGRIAGQTVDRRGKRCWVLTLQTREQHIRREKATSNICTNQGLFALRTAVYLAALGPQGLRETAELCLRKSHYAAKQLASTSRFSLAFRQPFVKEFVTRDSKHEVVDLLNDAEKSGFLAGLPLGRWYPELDDCFLVAVTEKRTKQEIDALARCLEGEKKAKATRRKV